MTTGSETRTAIVTGIGGQDGVYMARLLAESGYRIVGLVRPGKCSARSPRSALPDGVELLEWDMSDQAALEHIIATVRPTEFYNFAAFSSGSGMFDEPVAMGDINGIAVTRILEAIRARGEDVRFCQASSSEMFGEALESPQNEQTPFNPRSPYGAAKLYAHSMVGIYRRQFGLFACSAILFNHESPLRSLAFVTRKVAHAAASIKLGLAHELALGNLEARRDWGFAGDAVEAMSLMLKAPAPADYVIATGAAHSVRDLCEAAFNHVGLDYREFVKEDSTSYRPGESRQLVGDPAKAGQELGWSPKIGFSDLVKMMVDADLERLQAPGQSRSE
jgi:GDPmannose 4,6-dehydratase